MQRIAILLGVLAARVAVAEPNHCELTVTGDATVAIKADAPNATSGKLAATTDYWMTEAQIRSALSVVQGLGQKLTPAEKQKKVDEAMKRDPRFMLLMINCLTDQGGVIFGPASKTKYADVPMKPATYAIVSGQKSKPAEFTAMFHVSPGGKHESYWVSEPGKLVLSQFDKKGIAGTFSFKAEQRGTPVKRVSVTGSFRYACTGEVCQK